MAYTILIVDDDRFTAEFVRHALLPLRATIAVAPTAKLAAAALSQRAADLVLLDVTLPDASGYDVCRWLRAANREVAIMFVSGHADVAHRLKAFDCGADDYLVKPFVAAELVARARALLRRKVGSAPRATIIAAGAVTLDLGTSALTLPDQRVIRLTPTEAQIMAALLARPGQVIPRAMLAQHVWGPDRGVGTAVEHALDAHLRRLRAKVETDPAWPRYIQLLRGLGARFLTQPDRAEQVS